MQLLTTFLSLLTLFSNLATASSFSTQLCTTKVGTKSIKPVPSTTYALTITLTTTARVTSTPVTTTTPRAVTTTVSTTKVVTVTTTAPTNTGTITTTVTNTGTTTTTSTSTEIDTATASTTTTNNGGTSTIDAPPGFTAIMQEPGYVPKVRVREALGVAARAAAPSQIVVKGTGKDCTFSPQLYPTSVICGRLVETVTTKTTTTTAKTTATITAATPTSTVTSTITSTVTSTVYPATVTSTATATVSTTLTSSTATTITTTTTTTVTTTINNPASTAYAACGPSNIATNANGGHAISEVDGGNGNSASFVTVGTPYDCCVACITSTDNCRAFVYIGISGFECELITGTTCDPGVAAGGEQFLTDPSNSSPGLPVGNGRCGILADGGDMGGYW